MQNIYGLYASAEIQCSLKGILVNDMRYLASVVTTCFSSFGELLALQKRFAELSGGVVRYVYNKW